MQKHHKSAILGELILCTKMFIKMCDLFLQAEGLVMSFGFGISIHN